MNIEIRTPELERLVQEEILSGRFHNVDELFTEALKALRVAREKTRACAASAAAPDMPPEEWVRKFRAWTHSHAGRNLPVLSDEAMSRDSIYADRGR